MRRYVKWVTKLGYTLMKHPLYYSERKKWVTKITSIFELLLLAKIWY